MESLSLHVVEEMRTHGRRHRMRGSIRVAFFGLLLVGVASQPATLPYVKSENPTQKLYTISERGRSAAELLFVDTLAGNLARRTPTLYRVTDGSWRTSVSSAAAVWLQEMVLNNGVTVDDSLLSAPVAELASHFAKEINGFVLCNATDPSVSAALTYAAAGEGIVVAGNEDIAAVLKGNFSMERDLRSSTIADVLEHALPNLSNQVYIFQDNSKSSFLGDYAVFARAATMEYGSDSASQTTLLEQTNGVGVALGWGPENDFVGEMNSHAVWVHASDFSTNFAALSNVPRATSAPVTRVADTSHVQDGVHTISFVVTDGDNLQWTLGDAWISSTWYGSNERGHAPVGWTYSPASAFLAPPALACVVRGQTEADELQVFDLLTTPIISK